MTYEWRSETVGPGWLRAGKNLINLSKVNGIVPSLTDGVVICFENGKNIEIDEYDIDAIAKVMGLGKVEGDSTAK